MHHSGGSMADRDSHGFFPPMESSNKISALVSYVELRSAA